MIHYSLITQDDIGPITRLMLIMHEESPAYRNFEPDYEFGEAICARIIDGSGFGNLAYEGTELVGLMLGIVGNIPWVKQEAAHEVMLYVKPEYRNGTIAMRLIRSFEDWAFDKHLDYVFMGVSAEINSAMVNQMYLRLGYENSGHNFRKHLI